MFHTPTLGPTPPRSGLLFEARISVISWAELMIPELTPLANLTVTVASGDSLDVRDFHVHAALSTLFQVDLGVVSDNPDIDFEAVVGKEASFTIHGGVLGGRSVTWSGLCNELHQVGVEAGGLSTYRVQLVPALWLLSQRRNHRMFQQVSEVEIVEALLGEWNVPFEKRLRSEYKKRKYRVQYGESDYAFLSRLLEDAGVTFHFEEREGQALLVLSDAPQAAEARGPIPFRDQPSVADREHVTAVHLGRVVRPGKYTMRDVDHRRSPDYPLVTTADGGPGVEAKLERFHYTPGAFLFASERGDETPVADDRGKHRTDEAEGQKLAQKRLGAQRGDALACSFETNVMDLAPGVVMSMQEHPHRALGDGKRLLVVSSRLHGKSDGAWSHHVDVRSADAPYYPELRTPKPKVSGVESATVVGPAGEEIHTDELGRVRVHFHWDRESQMNEGSSCWIPVSQPWGGAGFGGSNLPRIGQEVIVDFLSGDPDRPVVVGRVFTALQTTPYKLPHNKTQSGWKSSSSPSTGGYNELMFEDAAGHELLRMQAEKDLSKRVKNDESVNIGNDRVSAIGRDESQTVGNDFFKQIVNSAREMVGMNRSRSVGVDETVDVGRNQKTNIGEKLEIVCGKSSITMEKSGKIVISGTDITVKSTGHVQVDGDPIDLN